MLLIPAVIAAVVLALVHLFTPRMRFLRVTPRSVWLSLAGGVSVAYVFVHLIPELAEAQQHLSIAMRRVFPGLSFAERHVYLIALAGLAAFYGLDKLAKRSRGQSPSPGGPVASRQATGRHIAIDAASQTSASVFWIHMASFGLYNALIGYLLLHREVPGLLSLSFFTVAMALHFLVTDIGLQEDHKQRYVAVGRWLLIIALGAGVALGAATELSKASIAVLVAVLAGGVILNVLKEEVPAERESRFWAFTLGMVAYAILLLTL